MHLFDEMVTSLPEGVSIKSVQQKGPAITISGVAQSNARVSSFMRKLKASKWLGNPQLDVIQAQNEQGQRVSNFTMRFSNKHITFAQKFNFFSCFKIIFFSS